MCDGIALQHAQAQQQGQFVLQCVLLTQVASIAVQVTREQKDAFGAGSFKSGRGGIGDGDFAKLQAGPEVLARAVEGDMKKSPK